MKTRKTRISDKQEFATNNKNVKVKTIFRCRITKYLNSEGSKLNNLHDFYGGMIFYRRVKNEIFKKTELLYNINKIRIYITKMRFTYIISIEFGARWREFII